MAKTKLTEEKEIKEAEGNDVSASMGTLHPKSGSNGSGEGEDDVAPGHAAKLAAVMGALANQDTLTKYYDEMMACAKDTGAGGKVVAGSSESNKATIKTHPSAAVGEAVKIAIKADVAGLLEGTEGLTEEFKEKAATIFEAAINARLIGEVARLEEENEKILGEEIETVTQTLSEKVEVFAEYVADQWMTENEVAIESALRNEIASEFIEKLRNLFVESNIRIPEEEVEVVDTLAAKVDELEQKLSEAIEENAQLKKAQEQAVRKEAVEEAAKGLTLAAAEKFKELAEGVEAESQEDLTKKLKTIREGLKDVKSSTVATLMEETSEDNKTLTEGEEFIDPAMRKYVQAIRRTSQPIA